MLIALFLASIFFVYEGLKGIKMPFKDRVKDLEESRIYAEKHGKFAIMIFTIITVIIGIVYLAFAYYKELIPHTVMYVLIFLQILGTFIDNLYYNREVKFGKMMFIFEKFQRVISVLVSIFIVYKIII